MTAVMQQTKQTVIGRCHLQLERWRYAVVVKSQFRIRFLKKETKISVDKWSV